MVDQVANFKKVTVSTGYNNTATSIVLATGQGAELPDPSGDNYNVVWWDSTNYPDPADDPNVEVVRVTAKSTDTLTVTRNQESSGASNKNNADATYKMHLGVTAKTITDITNTQVLFNETATATNPTLLPTSDDDDTGLGLAGTDKLSLIAGGVEGIRVTESAGNIWIAIYGDLLFTATTGHPDISDDVSTSTNPVYIFHDDDNTGLGRAGSDQLSLIAGGIEGHRITEDTGVISHVLTGIVKTPSTDTRNGAGAISLFYANTLIVTDGVDAITLADGAEGQEKFLVMKTHVGDGTVTPAHLKNGTTITFTAVGDSAHLKFIDGDWVFMGGTATLA